jgi:hypothetical protein
VSEVNKSERRMSGKSSLECTGGSARVRAHFPDAIVLALIVALQAKRRALSDQPQECSRRASPETPSSLN